MIDGEFWMLDSFRIQNCSFKISQPVRSMRFQERFVVWVNSKCEMGNAAGPLWRVAGQW